MPAQRKPATNGSVNGAEAEGPRRTGLVQERSRRTRRKLVRAAMALWTERGFERGVEETTVDEITRAAGVTKGTFYFHFAHKEDILLELGWAAADAIHNDIASALSRGRSGMQALEHALAGHARRTEASPPAAVGKAITEFYRQRPPHLVPSPADTPSLRSAFQLALQASIDEGALGPDANAAELAEMLQAVVMDTLLQWAAGDVRTLRATLLRRTRIITSGAATLNAGD
ncbi:MAG: TetR family transcriptional regulator [Acidimicrobiia bacterium]